MEQTKDNRSQKGQNKVKKNCIPVSFTGWDDRISTHSTHRRQKLTLEVNPTKTQKRSHPIKKCLAQGRDPQQAPTSEGVLLQTGTPSGDTQQSGEHPDLTLATAPLGKDSRKVSFGGVKVHYYRAGSTRKEMVRTPPPPPSRSILKAPSVWVKDAPLPTKSPWATLPSDHSPLPQASTPSCATQQSDEYPELGRGPVKRTSLWKPPQHTTQARDGSETSPHQVKVGLKPNGAIVSAEVGASETTTVTLLKRKDQAQKEDLPQPSHHTAQARDGSEMDERNKLKEKNDLLKKVIHKFKQLEEELQMQKESQKESDIYLAQEREKNDQLQATLTQTLSDTKSELMVGQELRNKSTEENNKLKEENEALTIQVEQFKETVKVDEAFRNESSLKTFDKISNLELQLSLKKVTEAETLHKIKQLEEALQIQKESQKEADIYLAQEREKTDQLQATLTQTLSDTKSEQLQWQEEKSHLLQSMIDIQHSLEDHKKPKKLSLWKRFTRFFK